VRAEPSQSRGLRRGVAAVARFRAAGFSAEGTADNPPQHPLRLPKVQWPEDNPYSAAKVELGRFLYLDKRLSANGSVSCGSCHAPEKAFTDRAPSSTGIGGQKGSENHRHSSSN
jgi:cytochrome c peroxidase